MKYVFTIRGEEDILLLDPRCRRARTCSSVFTWGKYHSYIHKCAFYALLSHSDNAVAAHRCVSVHILHCCWWLIISVINLYGWLWKDGLFRVESFQHCLQQCVWFVSISFKTCEAATKISPPQPPPAPSPTHPAPPGAGGEPQKPPASALTWKYVPHFPNSIHPHPPQATPS